MFRFHSYVTKLHHQKFFDLLYKKVVNRLDSHEDEIKALVENTICNLKPISKHILTTHINEIISYESIYLGTIDLSLENTSDSCGTKLIMPSLRPDVIKVGEYVFNPTPIVQELSFFHRNIFHFKTDEKIHNSGSLRGGCLWRILEDSETETHYEFVSKIYD